MNILTTRINSADGREEATLREAEKYSTLLLDWWVTDAPPAPPAGLLFGLPLSLAVIE